MPKGRPESAKTQRNVKHVEIKTKIIQWRTERLTCHQAANEIADPKEATIGEAEDAVEQEASEGTD